ncbi:UNVERIFIED_CONTAM: hypothetical protein FKN15_029906 [Acipenser sinensis]
MKHGRNLCHWLGFTILTNYIDPSGKKFRSKPQLSRYLGNTVDLGCFDFRTGKMMPSKLQKNKQRLRNEHLSQSKMLSFDTCEYKRQFHLGKCGDQNNSSGDIGRQWLDNKRRVYFGLKVAG